MFSQHPVDRLIGDLIDMGRGATDEEVERILAHMANASCDGGQRNVRIRDRGVVYQGQVLGPTANSLTYHLIKRVVVEGQWTVGTVVDQYLADLQAATRSSAARLALYKRRGGTIAATITPTELVVPLERLGPRPESQILVLYAAERGIIISGYQISTLDQTGVPREARWLR